VLVVYIGDILLIESDIGGIEKTKKCLKQLFVTKDMGTPNYFLGIGIAHGKHGVIFSQRKYVLNLLEKTRLLGCKPASTLMDTNSDFLPEDGELLKILCNTKVWLVNSFISLLLGQILFLE